VYTDITNHIPVGGSAVLLIGYINEELTTY